MACGNAAFKRSGKVTVACPVALNVLPSVVTTDAEKVRSPENTPLLTNFMLLSKSLTSCSLLAKPAGGVTV